MGNLLQDLRYGARSLMKSPGFTLVAVLALALGVGANSAIFSVVDAVLLRPLPYENPERLFTLLGRDETQGGEFVEQSYPNFKDLRDQCRACEYLVTHFGGTTFLTPPGEEPERLRGIYATADLFPMLGARPLHGRVFTREEDQPGARRAVVLSHALWQRRFGGDPSIVGKDLPVGRQPATVVGVMPKEFRFPADRTDIDYWMAATPVLSPNDLNGRASVSLGVAGKAKAGATLQQVQSEVETIGRRLQAQYPETNTGVGFFVRPMHENMVGDLKTALLVLLGAVGCVLLIACANVANLLLARAASRQKEISIRTALGASRGRIVRQLLTESLLLSAAGGGLGLLLAMWGVDALVAASPADIPRISEVGLNARVVLFTAGVSVLTGVVFGLAPALQASKADITDALKEGGKGASDGSRRNRLRSGLVVAEIAVSLVLLVGAGLLAQSFVRLLDVAPGLDPKNLLTMDVVVRGARSRTDEERVRFLESFLERARAARGVESVAFIDVLPLGGSFEAYNFNVEGRAPFPPGQAPAADRRIVSHNYHQTARVPLLRGRLFSDQDRAGAPPVVLINETFARRIFAGEEPVGRRLVFGAGGTNVVREIVGVVGDVRHAGLEQEAGLEYYLPYAQSPQPARVTVVARAAGGGDPAALAAPLRAIVREADREAPVYNVRTMEQLLSKSVGRRRFNMMLLGGFAAVALVLAALGIYGVMAYSVTQRTHEIGVRVALGARPRDVLRMIVGHGMLLAALGVGLGLVSALALTRVMRSLLYGVSATDPVTFGGVALVLAAVAFVSCYLPARRATRVDPMVALRYE
jgi:putative ABC transport system permease protein